MDFITKALLKHNNKYNYSLVEYLDSFTKVKIICPIHGIFEQQPRAHLSGQGCKKCCYEKFQLERKFTNNDLICKFKEKHGIKYDYSLVVHKQIKIKVKIICNEHGIFEQQPSAHLGGHGCPKCGEQNKRKNNTKTTKIFIERAKEIHNTKYDYSLVEYVNAKTKVKIICNEHGIFEQQPSAHLEGQGCNTCRIINSRLTTEKFINKSKLLFPNMFDYNDTIYETTYKELIIICKKHGSIKISPHDHFRMGCIKCKHNRFEHKWLNLMGIPDTKENRQVKIILSTKYIKVDGYIPETKTVYLFHGDYWHGNPKIYESNVFNSRKNKKMGELYSETIEYEKSLQMAGYNVISIWEYDFINDLEK